MAGSNHVNPANKTELAAMNKWYGSPEKHARVEGIHQSQGMKSSLSYMDNDVTYGLVDSKHTNKAAFLQQNLVKDPWRPKTSLRWTQDPNQRLTLQ